MFEYRLLNVLLEYATAISIEAPHRKIFDIPSSVFSKNSFNSSRAVMFLYIPATSNSHY